MGYVKNNLLSGEKVLFETKLNVPKLFSMSALFFTFAIWVGFSSDISAISFFLFLCSLIMAGKSFIQLKSSEYAVTNKRVILKDGFIKRRSVEVMLNKVEGIGLEQTIPDRVLGCGTLVFMGTGGTKEFFRSVDNAMAFRKAVQEAISNTDSKQSA